MFQKNLKICIERKRRIRRNTTERKRKILFRSKKEPRQILKEQRKLRKAFEHYQMNKIERKKNQRKNWNSLKGVDLRKKKSRKNSKTND